MISATSPKCLSQFYTFSLWSFLTPLLSWNSQFHFPCIIPKFRVPALMAPYLQLQISAPYPIPTICWPLQPPEIPVSSSLHLTKSPASHTDILQRGVLRCYYLEVGNNKWCNANRKGAEVVDRVNEVC